MAAKRISLWCAGVLIVGGTLFLGGNQTRAADAPAAKGQLQPIAPAANGQLQPIPDQSAAMAPQADNGQSQMHDYMDESLVAEEDGCVDFCGLPCCSLPGRFWLRTDYLMWWTNGMRLPPLVTTSPQGTPVAAAGVLPGATILYGNKTVADYGRSGFRTSWGLWLDNCHTWGIEGDYFALGAGTSNFSQYSTGNPILTRPLYDVYGGEFYDFGQRSELVAYPDVVEGSVTVRAKDYFQSTGVALSYNLCCCDSCDPCADPCADSCLPLLFCCRTDLLIGYRHYRYSNSVAIRENLRLLTDPHQNWLFQVDDGFRARNDFHGSEFGLRSRIYRGRWSLEILTKIALGNTHQVMNIDGQTIVTPTSQPTQIRNGGVFAVRSNEGTYTRDTFTMIPQLGLELGYQVNSNWRAYVGYNLLYWGAVVHASEQIDLNIDPRNFPPVQNPALPFPAFPGKTSSFWAQGLNLGLEFRF